MLDFENLKRIKAITDGKAIELSEVQVQQKNAVKTVWKAFIEPTEPTEPEEQIIYGSGTLADGVAYQNFTNSNGYFHAYVDTEQGEDPPYESSKSVLISFDFTDYDYIDITLDYQMYANYGGASISYGIDGYTPTQLPHSNNERINTTITFDISSYSGVHSIDFVLYALNESSEPSWGASSSIWISEIKMYNANSGSGGGGESENVDVDITSTYGKGNNVILYALVGKMHATDDGDGNVTLALSGATDDITIS